MRIYADLQKTHQDVLRSNYEQTAAITSAQERYELAEEARNQRNTQNIIDNANHNSAYGLTATERNGSANLAATQKVGSDLGQQAERLTNENMLQFSGIKDRVTDYFYQTSKDFCHTNESIFQNKYDLSKQAGDYFSKSQVDLIKVENSLGRQADHNYTSTQKQLCELGLQAANNTAAIQIEALKTKGDILGKLAECCCEIQQKVTETGESIKGVFSAADTNRLRDALHLAETRSIYNQPRPWCGFPPFPPGPFPGQGPQ
jgi:hypothetical protein